MSLINDALKRARETQRNDPPSGAPPLPPVESPARGSAGWILAGSAILFLLAAGLVFGPALFGHKPPPALTAKKIEVPDPSKVAAAAVPAANAASAPAATAAPAVTNVTPSTVAIENPMPVAKTNLPAAAAIVEKWPKVQGIIFNSSQPLAIVSGQPVNVGDRVGNFQVKQITQDSVVLQRPDGMQKTLGIGD